MSTHLNPQIESKNLLRLTTVLYVDSAVAYNFNQETVITKTIESIFIGNHNSELSANDISTIIKEDYKMNFEPETIVSLVSKSSNFNSERLLDYSHDHKKYILFNLNNDYFFNLCRSAKPNYLDTIIRQLYKENRLNPFFKGHNFKSIESIIYKFLYNVFAKNFSNFSYLISETDALDNKFLKTLSQTSMKDVVNKDEIFIVNSFLDYEDPHKNKIIFDIATLAFEYCATIGVADKNLINNIEYLNKNFYLDTNILYRVLGINGYDRMNKTKVFINKCIESGQDLFITDATLKEFQESINYNCGLLDMYSPNANLETYDTIGNDEMTRHYFELKKKLNISSQQYKANILRELDEFINENNVRIVKTIKLNIESHKSIINGFASSLRDFTSKSENPKSKTRAMHDAWVFYYLYIQNSDDCQLKHDYKYKMITTDEQLINWEKDLPNSYKNICIKPSDWLSFLLRYISTTDDDFESFVSFLKLNYHRESYFDGQTIAIIVNEATKHNAHIEAQKEIINFSLANSYDEIQKLQDSRDYSAIAKVIENDTIKYMEQNHQNEIGQLNKELAESTNQTERIIDEKDRLEKENEDYRLRLDKSEKDKTILIYNDLKKTTNSLLKDLVIKWVIFLIISIGLVLMPKKTILRHLNFELPQTILATLLTHIVLSALSGMFAKIKEINIPTYSSYKKAKKQYEDYKRDNNL
jgi:hypothetical protein